VHAPLLQGGGDEALPGVHGVGDVLLLGGAPAARLGGAQGLLHVGSRCAHALYELRWRVLVVRGIKQHGGGTDSRFPRAWHARGAAAAGVAGCVGCDVAARHGNRWSVPRQPPPPHDTLGGRIGECRLGSFGWEECGGGEGHRRAGAGWAGWCVFVSGPDMPGGTPWALSGACGCVGAVRLLPAALHV